MDGLKSDNINNFSFLFKLAMLNDVRKGSILFSSKLFVSLYLVIVRKLSVDRSWMYRRIVDRIMYVEFKDRVEKFIQFALENPNANVDNKGRI